MDYAHEHEGLTSLSALNTHLFNVHVMLPSRTMEEAEGQHVEHHVRLTMDAIEASAKEAHANNPEVSEDDAYHDIAQSLMTMCHPDVAKEVARRTGVPQLNVRTDDEEETWLSYH